MSDRTVAEVMGWRPLGDPLCPDGWVKHDGTRVAEVCTNRPNSADQLGWLIDQGWCPELQWDPVNGRYTVRCWRVGRTLVHHAPTLHAALEAAVLAVSAAQDVEQQGDDGEDDQDGGQHG